MISVRKVEVVKMENYLSFGMIAAIKFLDTKLPAIVDVLEFRQEWYSISGIIVSARVETLDKNILNSIYDCRFGKIKEYNVWR